MQLAIVGIATERRANRDSVVETCESRFCCRDVRIARLYNQNRVTPGPRKKMKKNLDVGVEPAYKPSLVDGMEILPTMMKTEDEKET